MYILVSNLTEEMKKDPRNHSNDFVSRITTFSKGREELDKVTGGLKNPFYVIKIKERMEPEAFQNFLNKLKRIDVSIVLDAEAAKFIKKKYTQQTKELIEANDIQDILKLIQQVG